MCTVQFALCMQYEDVQDHECNDDANNNNNNNNNSAYGDVFDTSNVNIDSDCYYTTAINNYQPRNYQIYFDDECNEFAEKPKQSAKYYECVSSAAELHSTQHP